jgi:hypothetical protein
MAGQQISQAIWTDEAVVESMHRLKAALTQWEEVGAAEEPDLDEMDETQERFLDALAKLNVRVHKRVAAEERLRKRTKIFKKYQSQIEIADSDLCWAISHLADMAQSHGAEQYNSPKVFRAVSGLIHALRQVGMVRVQY